MSALLDSIASIIDLIIDSVDFVFNFLYFTPNLIDKLSVFIIQMPLFFQIPIYATIFCAFMRAFLSRGGASS